MTPAEIARLRGLCEALSNCPPPWLYSRERCIVETTQVASSGPEKGQTYGDREWGPLDEYDLTHEPTEKDHRVAAFIAAARAALPVLLDEVERLRGVLGELLPWAENWLPDDAMDQGAREAVREAVAALKVTP